jgi:hypothetical protein
MPSIISVLILVKVLCDFINRLIATIANEIKNNEERRLNIINAISWYVKSINMLPDLRNIPPRAV